MAARKKVRKPVAAKSTQPLDRLQSSMRSLQHDAQKLLEQTRKQAESIISRDRQKALDRIVGQAQKVRKELEQRARQAGKDIETRTEKFMRAMEKEAGRRFGEILARLDVPSRSELQNLNRRLNDLEKKIKAHAHAKPKERKEKPAPAKTAIQPEFELPPV